MGTNLRMLWDQHGHNCTVRDFKSVCVVTAQLFSEQYTNGAYHYPSTQIASIAIENIWSETKYVS
jgi:hypothetical protein